MEEVQGQAVVEALKTLAQFAPFQFQQQPWEPVHHAFSGVVVWAVPEKESFGSEGLLYLHFPGQAEPTMADGMAYLRLAVIEHARLMADLNPGSPPVAEVVAKTMRDLEAMLQLRYPEADVLAEMLEA